MLIRAYDNEYPVQLCSVTGDHIRVAPRDLMRIAFSPLSLGFALAIAGALSVLAPGVYYTTPELPEKAAFWTGQLLATYGVFLACFALFDYIGRRLERSYVMITIGFQAFALVLTLPWAYVIAASDVSFPQFLSQIELGHFLGHLIIAVIGELMLVLYILPEQIRHIDMQNEIESGQRQKQSLAREGNCAARLALRGIKAIYGAISTRLRPSSNPDE